LTDLDRHGAAAADWAEFARVAPPQFRALGRLQRAISLARAGLREETLDEAEALARLPKLPPSFHYSLARVAALCAAASPSRPLARRERFAQRCANKALAWLQAAHKAGFFKSKANRDRLLKDPDLATLRQRPDFKAFLRLLEP